MAKVSLWLDTRRAKKNGEYPIKLVVYFRKQIYISLPFSCKEKDWNGSAIMNDPNMDIILQSAFSSVRTYILFLEMNNKLQEMTDDQIKSSVMEKIGLIKPKKNNFIDVIREYYSRGCLRSNTVKVYQFAEQKVISYSGGESISFESMTPDWLNKFISWLHDNDCSETTVNFVLRCIKAVFNYAIKNGITKEYPFKQVHMKSVQTRKRNLTLEQLRQLRDLSPVCAYERKHIDIFMLMFYLLGINSVDLFNAKQTDVVGGRLNYIRSKTGKEYSVKLEPEALEIIEKYKGADGHLLDLYEQYRGNLHMWQNVIDKALQHLGRRENPGKKNSKLVNDSLFPGLTTYWARHSVASIMVNELDISYDTVSAALGHEHGSRITNIYINYDERKVDRANRRLIDLLNSKE